jgi:hypothetical protein
MAQSFAEFDVEIRPVIDRNADMGADSRDLGKARDTVFFLLSRPPGQPPPGKPSALNVVPPCGRVGHDFYRLDFFGVAREQQTNLGNHRPRNFMGKQFDLD